MSGNVNINTKRGSNSFHGSLFEYNQNENMNARNQFLTSKPPLVYNQFGGSFGGPVVKNKLFFFGAYEGYRLRGFQTINTNVPTPEFKARSIAAVPAYKPLFNIYPNPTQPYLSTATTGVYQGAGTEVADANHVVVRGDYNLRDDTILTGRYTRGRPLRQVPQGAGGERFRTWSGTNEIVSTNLIHSRGRWTSETRFGFNYNDVNRLDNA